MPAVGMSMAVLLKSLPLTAKVSWTGRHRCNWRQGSGGQAVQSQQTTAMELHQLPAATPQHRLINPCARNFRDTMATAEVTRAL